MTFLEGANDNAAGTGASVPLPTCQKGGREACLDARRLQRVMAYIDANLTGEITVAKLASAASLSRFHFSRVFKATTGLSPSNYVERRRLELAMALLRHGTSIGQIAYDCGFSSDSNFVRSFRRISGLTPGRYRDQFRSASGQPALEQADWKLGGSDASLIGRYAGTVG